jgi:hypothetical protein
MSYILFDPDLYTALVAETSPVISINGDINMPYLAENCSLLRSVYSEALRLRKRDLAFRHVETDTHIAGKVLHGGNLAIIPMCQLTTTEACLGRMPAYSMRLVSNERLAFRTARATNIRWRQNILSGSFFAMQEIFAFVAVMLNRYRIQKQQGCPRLPEPDESSLTMGVS